MDTRCSRYEELSFGRLFYPLRRAQFPTRGSYIIALLDYLDELVCRDPEHALSTKQHTFYHQLRAKCVEDSYVSKIENGVKKHLPRIEVEALIAPLKLSAQQRAALLYAAGYHPLPILADAGGSTKLAELLLEVLLETYTEVLPILAAFGADEIEALDRSQLKEIVKPAFITGIHAVLDAPEPGAWPKGGMEEYV